MESNILEIIEEFMDSALVLWVQLFEKMLEKEDSVTLYSEYMEVNSVSQRARDRYLKLTDGIFLNEVMRVIDQNPKVEQLYNSGRGSDHMLRVQNFSILNRHIRAFYQENLQQLILMPLPNVALLGQDPLTEAGVEELGRLLLLLLGCAVQCENKETFIQQIQSLDIETQAGIASCIQEVTQVPHMVLPLQWEELVEAESSDLVLMFSSMAKHVQSLLAQKDSYLERIAELCQEREAQTNSSLAPLGGHSEEPPEGLALQLADSKAKLRRLKQQLEDKGDQILDYKQEIQTMDEHLRKFQKENRSLQAEVRGMRALRDELDCTRERAARAEHLQSELQSCKHKLRGLELMRTQLKEQQQLCAALQETKSLLEEQLSDSRVRCSSIRELEKESLLLRHKIANVEAERDTERQRVDELLEINMSLEADLRQCSNSGSMTAPATVVHRSFVQSEPDSDEDLRELIDQRPLSEEVGEASTLRLLGAEQENAELRRRLEELQMLQETDLPDAKDDLACLEMEHQKTLKEFQNLRNENVTLKQQLENLVTKLQHMEAEKKKKEELKKTDEQTAHRGIQHLNSGRGKGEGHGRDIEKCSREMIGSQRQAGVGEEVLQRKLEVSNKEMQSKKRGEAEGGQQDKREMEKETAVIDSQILTRENETVSREAVCSFSGPEMERWTHQLQEAQDEAEKHANAAQGLRAKLADQSRKAWEADQRVVLLEAELQRLKKTAENLGEARRQIEVLQSDSLLMEEELCRLVQLHRMQTTVIATLEGERAALERDRDTLRSTVDALRANQRKSDQLELTIQSLRVELERQGRGLDTCRRREEELEAELCEATLETQSLTRARDQALLEASRLEQEKDACQTEHDSLRKEARQREREVIRLRQQLESTTLALETSHQRARTVDTEHRRVCQQLSKSEELCTQLQDLKKELSARLGSSEEERQQLQEHYAQAQAQISTLSQDLANEQMHSQTLSKEVEHLNKKLQNAESVLKMTKESLNQSQQSVDTLSSNLKKMESLLELEKKKRITEEHDISSLEAVNKSEVSESQTEEMSAVDQSLKPGRGPDVCNNCHKAEETVRQLRESLAELEKEKAVAVAGQEALQSRLSQSQEACEHLKEQLEALRRHSLSLQDSCTRLQSLNTQLQIEQASVSSQHAAVLAQSIESKAQCAALEAESKVWMREREESQVRMEALRRDHEQMTALQQRQEVELEELLEKHSQLRSSYRSLETQNREFETRYQELLQRKAQLEDKEREMEILRVEMEAGAQSRMERQRELERLREDNERLQAQQKEWLTSQAELLAQGSMLRGELSTSQLEKTRLEGELSTLREAHQSLDISYARLTSQFQLLTQLKGNMEEENRHLAEQNQSLLKENRALLEQSLERRDQHYSQQREYQEKLGELRREKQKLVEKIMDQYRVLEPSMQPPSSKAKKSNWIADRMKKLIKPRGGGGREGRTLFTAAGSVENLADSTEFTSDTQTAQPANPLSAPVSPSPLRKVPSQTEPDISVPGTPVVRLGSGGRRKLGSRHGWGLGLARGGSGVSHSFSPGDNKTPPRLRMGSSPRASNVLWEGEKGGTPPTTDSPLSSQDSVEEEEGRGEADIME